MKHIQSQRIPATMNPTKKFPFEAIKRIKTTLGDLKLGLDFLPKNFKFWVFAKQARFKKLECSPKFVTHTTPNLRSPSVFKDQSECPVMKKNLINHLVQAQNFQKLRIVLFEFFTNR